MLAQNRPSPPQVLNTKPVPSHTDRFRLSLSDGENHIVGMLATEHSKVRSPARPYSRDLFAYSYVRMFVPSHPPPAAAASDLP